MNKVDLKYDTRYEKPLSQVEIDWNSPNTMIIEVGGMIEDPHASLTPYAKWSDG